MKKILPFLLLTALLTTACNDDNANSTLITPEGISGKWNLVNQRGGFQGHSLDFENGEVVWTFNSEDEIVAIENNSDGTDGINFPTAIYNYSMVTNEVSPESCDKTLNIEVVDLGCINIEGNIMTITPVGADMYTLTFKR